MTSASDALINDCAVLLAHALAIENEAVDRYEELADQMEVHNNPEVAAFFREMAEIEGRHVTNVEGLCGEVDVPHIPPWELAWSEEESPEAPKLSDDVHYLMTPYHAIRMAIRGERRAAAFFTAIAEHPDAPEPVSALARTLATDELEHLRLLQEWLGRYPEPERGWGQDPDPPMLQG
jgi:rubrerythrin